jgi:uncharacterized protein YutE (UPF0331/DUF86 family)
MKNDLILRKLENLRFYLQRVKEKTPSSFDLLCDDLDAQDIIVLNLERAIQECVDIALHIISEDNSIPVPDSMAQAFLTLRQMNVISAETAQNLAKAVGFRNIAVHAYQQIDWQIVYQIITSKLDDFKKFAQEITTNRQIL